jgi:hypothetical protein
MGYDAQGGFMDGVWGMESDKHLECGLGMKDDARFERPVHVWWAHERRNDAFSMSNLHASRNNRVRCIDIK